MAKKHRAGKTTVDFDVGIGELIPATQEAFRNDGYSAATRKEEKSSLIQFKKTFSQNIDAELRSEDLFPTDDEVYVIIIQYFASQIEYSRRDIDNMAKTVLDVLQARLYRDDSQVRTLLVTKKVEPRVPQNFAYVAVKKLRPSEDILAIKESGLERSITMFQELRSKGLL